MPVTEKDRNYSKIASHYDEDTSRYEIILSNIFDEEEITCVRTDLPMLTGRTYLPIR